MVNTPPVIVSADVTTVQEDTAGNIFQVLLQSTEPGATYSLSSNPSIGSGTVQIDANTGLITIPDPSNADVGGVYVFNIIVDDHKGGTATQFFEIRIANSTPIFTNLPVVGGSGLPTMSVQEDHVSTFATVDADDEGDGSTSYSIVSGLAGVSIDSATGLITVNTDNITVGQHTITIQFDDGTSFGDPGIITQDITLDVTNYEPHITSVDNVTWVEDAGYYSFDVQSDDEGQGSTTYSLGAGKPDWLIEGVNFNVDTGFMSLVPENEHVGYWEFTITVNDGNTATDVQLFHLTVTNDPPIFVTAGNAYFNVNGGAQTFDVHTDDENSDRDPAHSLESLPPVDANTYRLDGEPAGVTIDVKTGVISWDGVSGGEGDYTFTIDFYDGSVWIDQSFTLHITDTPPGGADHTAGFFSTNHTTMLEDEPNQEFDIEYIDEGAAGYEYRLDGTQPAGVTIDAASGVLTWSPINDDVTLPMDGIGYTFDIDVVDVNNGNAVVATEHFTLHVQNVVPWWQTPERTVTFTEDVAAGDQPTYDVNNTDEGHGDETEYSLVDGDDSVPYWLSIDDTGRIYVDATKIADAEDKLRNDDVGSWDIQVKFDDGHGGVIYQDLTVVLENVLTFLNANSFTWQEDSTTAFTLDADTDDDAYYPVTYAISNVPAWLSGHYTFNTTTGEFATNAGFAPDNTIPGQYGFTITANDGKGGASQTITLTVPNRDPVFPQTEFDMYEDDGTDTINLEADDELQGNTYYTWSGAPQWMSLDPIDGTITADPTNEHVGTYTFQVTQYDLNARYDYGLPGIDGYTTETITVTVHNRDPQLESGLSDTIQEDKSWTFNLQYDDEGVDGTTYSLDPADAAAYPWISIDEDTGVLTAQPTNANVGTFTFDVIVNDRHGGIVTDTFTLDVANRAPVFQNPPGTAYTLTVTEDKIGTIFDLLTDDEGQHNLNSPPSTGDVYYYIDPSASALVKEFVSIIDAEEGLLQINPTNRYVGTHTFSIFVDDGNPGGVTEMEITLVVENTTPRFTTSNAIIWYEDLSTDIPFDVNTTDEPGNQSHDRPPDPPADPAGVIQYSLIQTGDDISFLYIDPKTGEMSIDIEDTQNQSGANAGSPDNSLVGVYEFQIEFFDGTAYILQDFTLTINNSKTAFDTPIPDQTSTFTEGLAGTVDQSVIQAIDEYNVNNIVLPSGLTPAEEAAYYDRYDIDYYELYIDLNYQNAGLIRVYDTTGLGTDIDPDYDNAQDYNTQNDGWGGGDITFDRITGEITWTPSNADVPNVKPMDWVDVTNEVYHHRFVVRHFDGHGTMAQDEFFVEVVNVPPTIGDVNDWALVEDDTWLKSTHPQDTGEWMTTTQIGVTYELEWSLDGVTYVKWTDDNQPNDADGGIIIFDEDTGELIWQVTNADVTVDSLGVDVRSPYSFRVRADDGTPNETEGASDSRYSAWDYLDVTVQNVTTDFDETPPGPTNGSVTEDVQFRFNFDANDEESEKPSGADGFRNTYYVLEIDDDGDISGGYSNVITNQTQLDLYIAGNGLRSDDMSFNFSTGAFAWTPNHADVLHPNSYEFRVTHYDGHETNDTVTFSFAVDNVPPDVDLPSENNWILTEDTSTAASTLDIASDDDSYTPDEEFTFYFWSPTVDLDGQGAIDVDGDGDLDAGWEAVGDLGTGGTGIRPNGPDGGLLTYDSSTLELVWVTTNEDVTYNEDGSQGASHRMLVIATDGYPTGNPSWEEFDVEVLNADTVIDTANAPDSDPANRQTAEQNVLFHILGEDDGSGDPFIEANDEYDDDLPSFSADDRYELWIDDNDQIAQASLDDLTGLIKWDDWAADTGGSAITFVEKTGDIQWTPNNLDVANILDKDTTDGADYYHHEFVIKHIDGHGSVDYIHFYVDFTNTNVTPTLDPDPSTLPASYALIEDTTTLTITDATIESAEEGEGLTYYLQIWRDANNDDIVQDTEWVTIDDGDAINTTGGTFDLSTGDFAHTGAFTWTPNNADVTINEAGTAFLDPWKFRIAGNDGTPDPVDSWISNPYVFDVTVDNDPTNITSPGNLPAQPAGNITEDTYYSWNFGSKDERIESGNLDGLGLVHDSYFELKVDGVSMFTQEAYGLTNRYYDFTPTVGGGEITFDKEYGSITWTPNNADVVEGSYVFEVIHYDGQGSSAATTFNVTINNTEPPVVVPVEWVLTEDDNVNHAGEDWRWTLDEDWIRSDDEGRGNTVYSLTIRDGADTIAVNNDEGGGWMSAAVNAGGGEVWFNTLTGEIKWETTNADVNVDFTGSPAALPGTTTEVVYSNDFNDTADIDDFKTVRGNWQIDAVNGELYNPVNTSSGILIDEVFSDMDIEVDVALTQNDGSSYGGYGIFYKANYGDSNGPNVTGYYFLYNPANDGSNTGVFEIQRWVNGVRVADIAADVDIQTAMGGSFNVYGNTHTITISVDNDGIADNNDHVIQVDGITVFAFDDLNYTQGMVGFGSSNPSSNDVRIDDITVYQDVYTSTPYYFDVTADDGNGSTNTNTFEVHVLNDATDIRIYDPGTGTDHTTLNITEDVAYTLPDDNVISRDENLDGSYYSLRIQTGGGAWETLSEFNTGRTGANILDLNPTTGQFTWTANNLDVGDYVFEFTHNDQHGSTATDTVNVVVDNAKPTLPAISPNPWQLIEDDTLGNSTFDESGVESIDEGVGVTYELQYWIDGSNGGTADDVVEAVEWNTITTGYRPNGGAGGQIIFDDTYGEIIWQTTNADVTIASDADGNALIRDPYLFRIQADDGNDDGVTDDHLSGWREFEVTVENVTTLITSTPETAYPGGIWNITEDPSPVPDGVLPITVNEFDIQANDEEVESTVFAFNAYYDLYIDAGSGEDHWSTGEGPNTVGGGAAVVFDTHAGIVSWDANDADVGSYTFRVVHHDGHGEDAETTFTVNVANKAPDVVVPADTNLIEDENAADGDPVTGYQIDIWSDDEVAAGVDYVIEFNHPTLGWIDAQGITPNTGGGTITYNTDTGIITWETTNADVTTKPDGTPSDPYEFRVRATDEHGGDSLFSDAAFTVTVSNAETSITDIADQTLTEDSAWQIPGTSVDALDEAVGGGFYTLTVQGYTDLADFNAGRSGANVLTIDGTTGQIDWTPNDGDVGSYVFEVTHDDKHGDTKTDTFAVTVNNKVPEVVVPADTNLIEDENAADGDDPTGYRIDIWSHDEMVAGVDYLIEIFHGGSWHDAQGYVPNTDGGTITYDTDTGTITWETTNADVTTNPDGTPSAPYQFRVTATDEHGAASLSSDALFTVTVSNAETVIDSIDDQTVIEDTEFHLWGDQGDPGYGAGDPYAYANDEQIGPDTSYTLYIDRFNTGNDADFELIAVYNANNGLGADIDPADFDTVTGDLRWTPNNADVGTHRFKLVHNDAHGDTDDEIFLVTVDNVKPTLDPISPDPWQLVEDDTLANSTLDQSGVISSDEGVGVTYELQYWIDGSNGGAADGLVDASGVEWNTITTGYEPNGSEGGQIIFDDTYGQIIWQTTNADVTLASDADGNALIRDPYLFRIQADDGNDDGVTDDHLSGWREFEVTVENVTTLITSTPETAYPGGIWNITEDPSPVPDGVLPITVNEFDIQANDEEAESTVFSFDAYYDLYIDAGSGEDHWSVGEGPNTLAGGAAVVFDRDSGIISWDADDADVGSYTFRVVHHDGHGEDAETTFTVNVANKAPDVVVPADTNLIEDENAADGDPVTGYQIDIWSDDEAAAGVDYVIEFNHPTLGWIDAQGITPNAGGGTITYDANTGIITWETTNADVTTKPDGSASDPYEFRVRATDEHGGDSLFSDAVFSVTVSNAETSITDIADQTLTEDSAWQIPGTSVDALDEAVGGGFYTLTVQGYTDLAAFNAGRSGANVLTVDSVTGQIDWTPNNLDVGNYVFEITHDDNHGDAKTDAFTVTVQNVTPTITAPAQKVLVEDSTVVGEYTLDESQISSSDEGVGVTYEWGIWTDDGDGVIDAGEVAQILDGHVFNPTDGGAFTFAANTDGGVVWHSTNADVSIDTDGTYTSAPYHLAVRANDGNTASGNNLSEWVNVNFIVENADTVIDPIADQTATEDVEFHLFGDTSDAGYTAGDPYAHASDEQVGPGTFYTLYIDRFNTGSYVSITQYNATNGLGEDIDPADFNVLTGELRWTPNNADVGTHGFMLVHDDGRGDTDDETFLVTVQNSPVSLTVPAVWDLTEDDTDPVDYTLPDSAIEASDEDQGAIYYLKIDGVDAVTGYRPNGDEGGAIYFDQVSGEIQWQTTNADVGMGYEFEITVVDTNGDTNTEIMIVNVHNDPTSINDIPDQTFTEDGMALNIGDAGVSAKDEGVGGAFYTLEIERVRPDGTTTPLYDVATYNAINGEGADIFFDPQTGEIKWDTTNRDVGEYNFTVTHHDTHGSTATDSFHVTAENNHTEFLTEPPADYVIVPVTLNLTYDALADDEGQHDALGWDQVTYSLTSSPGGMSIDPMTGLIDWTAPAYLAGQEFLITIMVEDGNGGYDLQSFMILVDATVQDIPWEARAPYGDSGLPGTGGNPFGDNLPPKEPEFTFIPKNIPLKIPSGDLIEEFLKKGNESEGILEQLQAGGKIVQPTLEPGGTIVPPTKLWGFLAEGLNGRRLDFNLEEIELCNDLVQPTLDIGGSQSPDTPLEGFAPAVESGKRLNFAFFPIEDVAELDLDGLKVSDLLDL
ncbi:MAG: putative Ig domain-containing protein [Pseudomonadota bacterium]